MDSHSRIRRRFRHTAALLAVISLAYCACGGDGNSTRPRRTVHGSGTVVEEERAVSMFSGITLATVGHVLISQGETEALRIVAEDNLLPLLQTVVEDGDLFLRHEDDVQLEPTRTIEFHVSVLNLERTAIAGVGSLEAPNISTDNLSVVLTGVGNVDFSNLAASALNVILSGVGDARFSGGVEVQTVMLSGVADHIAGDLASREARVMITGIGSATVRVDSLLDVTITGNGDVCYIGAPIVESVITGSGVVKQIGQ